MRNFLYYTFCLPALVTSMTLNFSLAYAQDRGPAQSKEKQTSEAPSNSAIQNIWNTLVSREDSRALNQDAAAREMTVSAMLDNAAKQAVQVAQQGFPRLQQPTQEQIDKDLLEIENKLEENKAKEKTSFQYKRKRFQREGNVAIWRAKKKAKQARKAIPNAVKKSHAFQTIASNLSRKQQANSSANLEARFVHPFHKKIARVTGQNPNNILSRGGVEYANPKTGQRVLFELVDPKVWFNFDHPFQKDVADLVEKRLIEAKILDLDKNTKIESSQLEKVVRQVTDIYLQSIRDTNKVWSQKYGMIKIPNFEVEVMDRFKKVAPQLVRQAIKSAQFGGKIVAKTAILSVKGIRVFVMETMFFSTANVLATQIARMYDSTYNPLFWRRIVDNFMDPKAHAGFAAFIAANRAYGSLERVVPTKMKPFFANQLNKMIGGMAMGGAASHLVGELLGHPAFDAYWNAKTDPLNSDPDVKDINDKIMQDAQTVLMFKFMGGDFWQNQFGPLSSLLLASGIAAVPNMAIQGARSMGLTTLMKAGAHDMFRPMASLSKSVQANIISKTPVLSKVISGFGMVTNAISKVTYIIPVGWPFKVYHFTMFLAFDPLARWIMHPVQAWIETDDARQSIVEVFNDQKTIQSRLDRVVHFDTNAMTPVGFDQNFSLNGMSKRKRVETGMNLGMIEDTFKIYTQYYLGKADHRRNVIENAEIKYNDWQLYIDKFSEDVDLAKGLYSSIWSSLASRVESKMEDIYETVETDDEALQRIKKTRHSVREVQFDLSIPVYMELDKVSKEFFRSQLADYAVENPLIDSLHVTKWIIDLIDQNSETDHTVGYKEPIEIIDGTPSDTHVVIGEHSALTRSIRGMLFGPSPAEERVFQLSWGNFPKFMHPRIIRKLPYDFGKTKGSLSAKQPVQFKKIAREVSKNNFGAGGSVNYYDFLSAKYLDSDDGKYKNFIEIINDRIIPELDPVNNYLGEDFAMDMDTWYDYFIMCQPEGSLNNVIAKASARETKQTASTIDANSASTDIESLIQSENKGKYNSLGGLYHWDCSDKSVVGGFAKFKLLYNKFILEDLAPAFLTEMHQDEVWASQLMNYLWFSNVNDPFNKVVRESDDETQYRQNLFDIVATKNPSLLNVGHKNPIYSVFEDIAVMVDYFKTLAPRALPEENQNAYVQKLNDIRKELTMLAIELLTSKSHSGTAMANQAITDTLLALEQEYNAVVCFAEDIGDSILVNDVQTQLGETIDFMLDKDTETGIWHAYPNTSTSVCHKDQIVQARDYFNEPSHEDKVSLPLPGEEFNLSVQDAMKSKNPIITGYAQKLYSGLDKIGNFTPDRIKETTSLDILSPKETWNEAATYQTFLGILDATHILPAKMYDGFELEISLPKFKGLKEAPGTRLAKGLQSVKRVLEYSRFIDFDSLFKSFEVELSEEDFRVLSFDEQALLIAQLLYSYRSALDQSGQLAPGSEFFFKLPMNVVNSKTGKPVSRSEAYSAISLGSSLISTPGDASEIHLNQPSQTSVTNALSIGSITNDYMTGRSLNKYNYPVEIDYADGVVDQTLSLQIALRALDNNIDEAIKKFQKLTEEEKTALFEKELAETQLVVHTIQPKVTEKISLRTAIASTLIAQLNDLMSTEVNQIASKLTQIAEVSMSTVQQITWPICEIQAKDLVKRVADSLKEKQESFLEKEKSLFTGQVPTDDDLLSAIGEIYYDSDEAYATAAKEKVRGFELDTICDDNMDHFIDGVRPSEIPIASVDTVRDQAHKNMQDSVGIVESDDFDILSLSDWEMAFKKYKNYFKRSDFDDVEVEEYEFVHDSAEEPPGMMSRLSEAFGNMWDVVFSSEEEGEYEEYYEDENGNEVTAEGEPIAPELQEEDSSAELQSPEEDKAS
ncbi:MAG: hypothetical protein AB8E15_00955 [Bdellovibrionales bacterium]